MRRSKRITYSLASRVVAKALGTSGETLEDGFAPAVDSELDKLLALRATHQQIGHRPDDRAYLLWRYDFTGAHPGRAIWVMRHQGEIIASLGVEGERFRYGSTDVQVHKLMDLLAREDYMGSGLGAWMDLRLQQIFENTLLIGSTRHSHSIVTKLNTRLPDWQTWRYPIRLRHRHPLWATVDPLLSAKRRIFKLLVRRGARMVRSDTPPAQSEALRDSMAGRCIMPSRTGDKASWRFTRHPYRTYSHFQLFYGERLAAAAVAARSGQRAELCDALTRGDPGAAGAKRALSDLLTLVIAQLAHEGVSILSTRVNDPFTAAALRHTGFIRRPESCPMGCHFRNPDLAGWLDDGVPLFLMPADSDFD